MAARGKRRRIQVWIRAQLDDALGDLIGMSLLILRMFQELSGGHLGANSLGDVVVALVAQHAHQFRCQRLIQQLDDRLTILGITRGYRPILDVGARPLPQRGNIGNAICDSRRQLCCFIRHEKILLDTQVLGCCGGGSPIGAGVGSWGGSGGDGVGVSMRQCRPKNCCVCV